jgi:hypothetical protein
MNLAALLRIHGLTSDGIEGGFASYDGSSTPRKEHAKKNTT